MNGPAWFLGQEGPCLSAQLHALAADLVNWTSCADASRRCLALAKEAEALERPHVVVLNTIPPIADSCYRPSAPARPTPEPGSPSQG